MPSPPSPITRRAAATLAFSASMGLAAAACGNDKAKRLGPGKKDDPAAMEAWWADLEKDETAATRALLNLADRRDETVTFLKAKMKPLKISAAGVRALLLRLGSGDVRVWKSTREELEYFDPRLAIDLEALMDHYKEAPGRQRMVEVLSSRPAGELAGKEVILTRLVERVEPTGPVEGFNFLARPNFGSWRAEHKVDRINQPEGARTPKKKWTRAVRALVLLEHIGTPDAVAILKDMATGHPDAQPTKVARDSLERLGKSGKAP
jgi:hypothetical protein